MKSGIRFIDVEQRLNGLSTLHCIDFVTFGRSR